MANGILSGGALDGSTRLQMVPIVIRYAAGTPSVLQNPTGESIALTDTGTGKVTITLASASLAPLICVATSRPAAPGTLAGQINIDGATTTTAVVLTCNAGDDGATETDPVDIHAMIIKQVAV